MEENFDAEFQERLESKKAYNEGIEKGKEIALQNNAKEKSLSDLSIEDVKFRLDNTKDYEEQAQDVAMALATANAVKDEATAQGLSSAKKEELLTKAEVKVKTAQKEIIEAETEIQKAERESYEGMLETFGFYRHLPRWLLKAIVISLTPFYYIIGFIIGIPCGFIKILIENIDGIIVKYDKTGDKAKPRIRVTIWILLSLMVVAAVCLTTLGCLHII